MGNAHQQTAQERRKKLILKLNPSLKFMAEDAKSFSSAAPMLFGEEFAKQATATCSRAGEGHEKAEHSFGEERSFFRLLPPKLSKRPRG